jgi:hypothetical protein
MSLRRGQNDVSRLPPGAYFILMRNPTGRTISSLKVLKTD